MTQLFTDNRTYNESIINQYSLLETYVLNGLDWFVIGGSVRRAFMNESLGSGDIDIFFKNQKDIDTALKRVKKMKFEKISWPNSTTFNSTYKLPSKYNPLIDVMDASQFIMRPIDEEEALRQCDFTVCQFLYKTNQIYFTKKAYDDCISGTLAINEEADLTNFSEDRVLKYLGYGFAPSNELFARLFIDSRSSYTIDSSTITGKSSY